MIKPNSSVDPKVKSGVLKGFLSRAKNICSPDLLEREIDFIINVFVESGYEKNEISKTATTYLKNFGNNDKNNKQEYENLVSMPWIPGISNKIKKAYKDFGLNITFKSQNNLKNILCSKNKSKNRKHSNPGVYRLKCECGGQYIGETGASVSTRVMQHQKSVFEGKWGDSGLAEHAKNCKAQINWNEVETLSIEPKFFPRAVRESLEIQKSSIYLNNYQHFLNKDNGRYVETNCWKPVLEKIVHDVNRT